MMKRLVTLALMMIAVFTLVPIQTYAQNEATYSIEEYDFGSWTKKVAVDQTLNLESSKTSTTRKTVYLLENFVDKDQTPHSLNGRFAFEKSADTHPYGWQKFCGYSTNNTIADDLMTCGLQLKQKNLTISILNLKAGDVVIVWHNGTLTAESSEDGLYITSTNASYNGSSHSTGSTKTAGNALVSGTPYTMTSDGTFDFTYSSATESYIRKVTIKKKEYTVSAAEEITNGTVTFCKTADGEYTSTLKACEGEMVYVKAQAAESYKLATLTSGDLESLTTSEATSFTMPRKDVTISAIFEESNTPRYTLTINTPTNGQIKIGDNPATTQSYEENATITLTAEANIGYEFEKWQVKVGNEDFADVTGDNEDNIESVNGSTLTVKMTKDFMVSAVFKTTTYNITYNLSDGTNNQDNPLTYTIESNDITLQAPTKEGYTFTGWTWAGQETPEMNVTIAQGSTGNREYTANWSQDSAKPKVTVSVSDANSGTIKYIAKVDNKDTAKDFPNEGLEIDENGSVTLVAVPASSSYRLKSWNVGGVDKGNSLKLELSEITSDVSVSAEFESQSAVTAITTAKTWTFDSFTAKTELSGTASYEYQGLFINGNNNELTNLATAEVSGASAIEGEVSFEAPTSRVVLNGSLPTSNFDASNSKVNTIGNRNKNSVAFQAGVAGTVYVYMNGTYASDRNLCIYSSDNMSNPTTVALISNPSPQVVQRTVSANANIFIGVSGGTAYIYGVKFVPTPTIETISEVNISGLSAPIKGEELKNLSDLSTSTTGVSISSITWNPTTTPAAASTVYTATIVIEATSGYQFASEVSANAISEKNATITRNSDTQISVAYTFDATAADAISVTANGYSGTFDGAAHGISVTAEEGATITYRETESGDYTLTENPTYTNVGSYIVYYKVTKDNCEDVTGSKTVTINPAAGSINAFSPASGSVAMGTTGFVVTTTATGDGTITYSSSEGSVATINTTTGAVTPVAAGTTTITATVTNKDGGNYTYAAESNTATYELTVTTSEPVTYTVTKGSESHCEFTVEPVGDNVTEGATITVNVTSVEAGYYVKYIGYEYYDETQGNKSTVKKKEYTERTETITETFAMPALNITVKVGTAKHTHNFSYEIGTGDNSNVLTATCSANGCGLSGKSATLTLTANGGIYSGSAFAATTDLDAFNTATGLSATCSITYTGDNENYTETAPTNVGSYTAKATVTIDGTSYVLTKGFSITEVPVTTYNITVPAAVNGNSITADVSSAAENATVTLTIATAENYSLATITANNGNVTLSGSGNTRTFTMPAADVTITATWTIIQTDSQDSNTSETYTVTELGGIEVSKVTSTGGATSITIPATVGSANVTSIAPNAFDNITKSDVKSVDLSATSITDITVDRSNGVFSGFPEETMIYMPADNTAAGQKNVIIGGTCSDFEMKDQSSYNIPKAFTATKATLSRSFTSEKYCTLCLPYDVPATNLGGKIYEFSSIEGTTVKMTEDTNGLNANKPYIFVPNSNANSISASSVTISMSSDPKTPDTSGFTFNGVFGYKLFSSTEITNGVYGFAADSEHGASVGQFVKASSGAWIEGMRAYLAYNGDLNSTSTASTRGMALPEVLNVVLVHANGSTTSIGKLELMTAEDGSPVYNLSGQRVDKSYKGIVIQNGKKMIKK
ncbi:MAG: InlB B-repeat-containing protein [Bacteroidaceae bacterium]|nr:InlB B-repeat-containing protein [Bacteroidaceae bacterium]